MKLGERLAKLDHAQQTTRFKIIASAVLGLVLLAGFITLIVAANDPQFGQRLGESASRSGSAYEAPSYFETGPIGSFLNLARASVLIAQSDGGILSVAFIFAGVGAALAMVLWLGYGLTSAGIALLGWGAAWVFSLSSATEGLSAMLTAMVPLVITFGIGMRAVSALLSGPWPWAAIARNVMHEAVRMKISLIFIVLLIVVLALTPSMLNESQPLRYRVQQWLQYGTGLSYGVLSLLTLFLSVASVSYEQRDRVIWQTVTKPIPRWQYIGGKWLGVMMLNAVLLSVTSFGVYLYTEFLRYQPANGEAAYLIPKLQTGAGGDLGEMVEDRRILEDQILVARVSRYSQPLSPTEDRYEELVDQTIAAEMRRDSEFRDTIAERRRIRHELKELWTAELRSAVNSRIQRLEADGGEVPNTGDARLILAAQIIEEWEKSYRNIAPGNVQEYRFNGLNDIHERFAKYLDTLDSMNAQIFAEIDRRKAEALASPDNSYSEQALEERMTMMVMNEWSRDGRLPDQPKLMLRYSIRSGSNDPAALYKVAFVFDGFPPFQRQVSLEAPQVMNVPLGAVTADGRVSVQIYNGEIFQNGIVPNARSIYFEADGLELMYAVGGYEMNFLRIMGVIFVKLGFIAAVSIMVSTFLSFPVACMVAIAILFMAESSAFLTESLEYFDTKAYDEESENWLKVAARAISIPVAWMFSAFAELKPTSRLVDGLLVSWSLFFQAIASVGSWTVLTLTAGWLIFRNRELGTYSGH